MTTPTRLAEIAERHELLTKLLFATDWPPTEKQTTDEMWANHNRRGPDDAARRYLNLAAVDQDFILTAAQARSREDAEIMREAADLIARTFPFTQANLITKLRARADELEGRG